MEVRGFFRLQILKKLLLLGHVRGLQAQRKAQHLTRVVVLNKLRRPVHHGGRSMSRVWTAGDICGLPQG
jgi:hypothetical protein